MSLLFRVDDEYEFLDPMYKESAERLQLERRPRRTAS